MEKIGGTHLNFFSHHNQREKKREIHGFPLSPLPLPLTIQLLVATRKSNLGFPTQFLSIFAFLLQNITCITQICPMQLMILVNFSLFFFSLFPFCSRQCLNCSHYLSLPLLGFLTSFSNQVDLITLSLFLIFSNTLYEFEDPTTFLIYSIAFEQVFCLMP